MRTAATVLSIIHERGKRGLPLEDLYRQLYNTDLYLRAYARLYHHDGALTPVVNALKCEQLLPSILSTCPQS